MQEIEPISTQSEETGPRLSILWRRVMVVCAVVTFFALVALLPPLLTVNRFQRRIAASIGASLGRPVHLDRVTLTLLPLPGFTLENFVVSEDPAFGSEPVIRSNSVRATLRVSSLWRRRVEFSTISFSDPTSVNLVHLPDGRWNIESILLQASQINAAPTAQKQAGTAPRFPYIEATGARVNLKQGQEKMPFSLTDAEFALWLPNPKEWHLRLEAHPTRTDTSVSDAGVMRLEGTLGHAASLNDVPLDLQGEWRSAPLGEASRLMTGNDAGVRGELTLTAKLRGTVGKTAVQTRVQLESVRRAEFVPEHELSIDMQCLGTAAEAFHSFVDVRCNWPQGNGRAVVLTGSLPDVRRLDSTEVTLETSGVPFQTVVDWLHIASSRVPADLAGDGLFAGQVGYAAGRWTGKIDGSGLSVKSTQEGLAPLAVGDVAVEAEELPGGNGVVGVAGRRRVAAKPVGEGFVMAPTTIDLGGKDPVEMNGSFDAKGYTLHLSGMAVLSRLLALGAAIPQFGDGLKDVLPTNRAAGPVRVDLVATRSWAGGQVWRDGSGKPVVVKMRRVSR